MQGNISISLRYSLIAKFCGIKSIHQYPLFRAKDNIVYNAKVFTESVINQIVSTEPNLKIKSNEKKYDKKVTASELWNYLISSRSEYDPEGMIISKIDTHKIEYFRGGSGDSPTSLTRSAFSQKLSRLRKNPPKTLL